MKLGIAFHSTVVSHRRTRTFLGQRLCFDSSGVLDKIEDIHIPPMSHDFPISRKRSKFVAFLII